MSKENVEHKRTLCLLCNSEKIDDAMVAKDYHFHLDKEFPIQICNTCHVAFLKEMPTQEWLNQYFIEHYPGYFSNSFIKVLRAKILYVLYSLNFDIKSMGIDKNDVSNIKVLDIGCGKGDFLEYAESKGFKVYGVEPFEGDANIARQRLKKGEIYIQPIKAVELEERAFDIITMWGVLEHLRNPKQVIEIVHNLLKKNGYFVIQIPNYDCFERKLFQKYWGYLCVPEHLYQYSQKSLKYLLNDRMEIIKTRHHIVDTYSFGGSILNWLDERLKTRIPINTKFLLSMIIKPFFLPLNFLCYAFASSSLITVTVKKRENL